MPISRRREKRAEEDKNPGNQSAICRIIGSWLKFLLLATLLPFSAAILIALRGGDSYDTREPIVPVLIAPPVPPSNDPIASTPGFGESSGGKVFGRQLPEAQATTSTAQATTPDIYGECLRNDFETSLQFMENYYDCLNKALNEKRKDDGETFDSPSGDPLIKRMYEEYLHQNFKDYLFRSADSYELFWIPYSGISDDSKIDAIGNNSFRVELKAVTREKGSLKNFDPVCFTVLEFTVSEQRNSKRQITPLNPCP